MRRPATIFHRIMFFVLIILGISAVGYAAIIISPRNRSITNVIQITPTTVAQPEPITVTPAPEPRPTPTPIPIPEPKPVVIGPVFTGVIITGIIHPTLTDIQKNIIKYRSYRERLKNRFVYVTNSNEHGSNLPASKTKANAGRNSDIIDF